MAAINILRQVTKGRTHQSGPDVLPPVNSELSFPLETAPNTLTINSSGALVAVGGRKVFLICQLNREQQELTTVLNLRDLPPKRALNLNYSCLDIQWRPGSDSQLVSASPNGSVVHWDLTKSGKNKNIFVFDKHERTVNSLCFRDENLLLSGSQDTTIRLFDLRLKEEVACFKGPDAVRDVKFFPYGKDSSNFAAALDNGVVQFWDTRSQECHYHMIAAHSGPVYSCEWHQEKENLLVTSGRDKSIHVFEVAGSTVKDTCVISTILPVSRVHWRPSYRTQVASCYQILDSNVSVWNTVRPYIPILSFPNHSDVITDFLWLNDKEILSCSKDNRILVQTMNTTDRPVDHVSQFGLSVGCHGDVAFSCHSAQQKPPSSSRNPTSFKRESADHSSSLIEYDRPQKVQDTFVECARRFVLKGQPVEELCQRNAKVCEELQLQDKANTWRILELLSRTSLYPSKLDHHLENCGTTERRRHVSARSGTDQSVPSGQIRGRQSVDITDPEPFKPESLGVEEDFLSMDSFKNDMEFFDEQNDEELSDVAIAAKLQANTQEWELPSADIHLLRKTKDIPERMHSPGRQSSMSGAQTDLQALKPPPVLSIHQDKLLPKWNSWPQVVSTIRHYSDKGDVQMSVSVLIVLSDHCAQLVGRPDNNGQHLLSGSEVVQWLAAYLEQLGQHQLWALAAEVRGSWPLGDLLELLPSYLSGSSPFLFSCGRCKRGLPKPRTQCQSCLNISNLCSYCQGPVKGLFLYCWKCSHGGHFDHLMEWFLSSRDCPSGCGCQCTLTNSQQI